MPRRVRGPGLDVRGGKKKVEVVAEKHKGRPGVVDKSLADDLNDVGADERNKNQKRNNFSSKYGDEENQASEDFKTANQAKGRQERVVF